MKHMLDTNLIKTFLEGTGSNLGHIHIPEVLLREMSLDWFQSKYILCLILPGLKGTQYKPQQKELLTQACCSVP